MKLSWCFLAAFIATAWAAIDVEKTVKQVQTILQANAQLPRLSREEIIELLNDIKSEDAKSKSSSTENSRESKEISTTPFSVKDNEIDSKNFQDQNVADEAKHSVYVPSPTTAAPETTTKGEPSVMVVLPYTPRDGSSLLELYTRPPRVEVLPLSKASSPRPFTPQRIEDKLQKNANFANQQKFDISAELQAFLDAHGLKGQPGQDSFLLPLDGFKPLPPAKVVDGNVQLPENILLTYDLIAPTESKDSADSISAHSASPHSYLYDPLRPQFPFELETSSSEQDKSVLPLEMPKKRKTKPSSAKPKFAPIDYDSIKVIPLNQGPSPFEDERATLETEQSKRQASSTENTTVVDDKPETTSATPAEESKDATTEATDSAADNSDSGASITDLEDSFGGAAPENPGDSELPPPKKNGFYWMLDWNSFLEVGDGDTKVNIRFEPKLGDPQMFLPVTVP